MTTGSKELDELEEILREAHRRLDLAGVPRPHRIVGEYRRLVVYEGERTRMLRIEQESVARLRSVTRTGPIEPAGDWAELAACKGQKMVYDQFPAVSHRPTKADRAMEEHALITCRTCPVLRECREWSLQPVEPAVDHIAGGLTPRQRHEIRANRERQRLRVSRARGFL